MHDPRVGRFFAIDPLSPEYSWNSPYAFSENVVIHGLELEGLENVYYLEKNDDGKWIKTPDAVTVFSQMDQNVNAYIYRNPNGSVNKTVYKGHQGNDRHENHGFDQAPYELMNAWYDEDKGPNSSENYNSRTGLKWWQDGGAEGGAEAGNENHSWSGAKGLKEKGIPTMLATLGVIFSGGSLLLAEGVPAIAYSSVGLLFSADDLTGIESASILESLVQEMGGDSAVDLLKGAKFAMNIKDAAKGIVNMTVVLADGKTYTGAYNIANDLWDIEQGAESVVEESEK